MKVDIPGFIGYCASKNGTIYSRTRIVNYPSGKKQPRKGVKLRPLRRNEYAYVAISIGGIVQQHAIHRLIALTFIPNPENKRFVNHKNGVKDDNRAVNLEWCTMSENVKHAYNYLGARGRLGQPVSNRTRKKISKGLKLYYSKSTLKP